LSFGLNWEGEGVKPGYRTEIIGVFGTFAARFVVKLPTRLI